MFVLPIFQKKNWLFQIPAKKEQHARTTAPAMPIAPTVTPNQVISLLIPLCRIKAIFCVLYVARQSHLTCNTIHCTIKFTVHYKQLWMKNMVQKLSNQVTSMKKNTMFKLYRIIACVTTNTYLITYLDQQIGERLMNSDSTRFRFVGYLIKKA